MPAQNQPPMNAYNNRLVFLTDTALIAEGPDAGGAQFLLSPAALSRLSPVRLEELLQTLRSENRPFELILSNEPHAEGGDFHFDQQRVEALAALLSNADCTARFFYRKSDIYFLDDYLLLARALGIKEVQFVLDYPIRNELSREEFFHLDQFLYKLIRESSGRDQQLYYRQQRKALRRNGAVAGEGKPEKRPVVDANANIVQREVPSYRIEWKKDIGVLIERGLKKLGGKIITPKTFKLIPETKVWPAENVDPRNWKKVLITGWYGTETNGDKAIIGEVVYFLRACSPDIKFIVTTIQKEISIQTNTEIRELTDSDCVPIQEAPDVKLISQCDAVIMGGGPLMESSFMNQVCAIFQIANQLKKNRIIFGCGVGPIHTDKVSGLVKETLRLATAGFLRDQASLDLTHTLVPGSTLSVACDPAMGFVRRWAKQRPKPEDEKSLALLVRANTLEFAPDMNKGGLDQSNRNAARMISALLSPFVQSCQFKVKLLQMNAPYVGGDDRIFNRYVGQSLPPDVAVAYHREYLRLEEQMEQLHRSTLSLAMRYHGHIFSIAMGIPFVSIDYTRKGGKVESLVRRIGHSKYSISWDELDSDKGRELLMDLMENREAVSERLLNEADQLVALLKSTYEKVFNLKIETLNY